MFTRTHAFCFASGLIAFGPKVPAGAIRIASGPDKRLRDFISGRARHGYRTKEVDGRPQKIRGSDTLLVPGVPEAPDQMAGGDALRRWCDWLKKGAPEGVTVT